MSRNRGRRSSEEISVILSDLKSSGMSQRAFAESRGISLSTLSYWKRRERGMTSQSLIPVRIAPSSPIDQGFELRLTGGKSLKVPMDFNPESLRLLLEVIESC